MATEELLAELKMIVVKMMENKNDFQVDPSKTEIEFPTPRTVLHTEVGNLASPVHFHV